VRAYWRDYDRNAFVKCCSGTLARCGKFDPAALPGPGVVVPGGRATRERARFFGAPVQRFRSAACSQRRGRAETPEENRLPTGGHVGGLHCSACAIAVPSDRLGLVALCGFIEGRAFLTTPTPAAVAHQVHCACVRLTVRYHRWKAAWPTMWYCNDAVSG
jgi:hypothetical protein